VIHPTTRSGYAEIADARKTIPTALALGMLDKDLKVGEKPRSAGRKRRHSISPRRRSGRASQARDGDFNGRSEARAGLFSGDRAGTSWTSRPISPPIRDGVAKALDLPPTALREDPSLSGDWQSHAGTLERANQTRSSSRACNAAFSSACKART